MTILCGNNDAAAIDYFPGNNALCKFKQKTAGQNSNDGTKDVEIMVFLKYLK